MALLALLDPYSLAGRHWMTLAMWLERCGRPTGLERLGKTAHYLGFRIKRGLRSVHGRARRVVLFRVWEHYRRTGKTLPFSLRRPDHANRSVRLARGQMPFYDGDATYFKANFNPKSKAHPDSQETWRALIRGRLDIVPLTCTHTQVIAEPHVQEVARELEKALAAARARDVPAATL